MSRSPWARVTMLVLAAMVAAACDSPRQSTSAQKTEGSAESAGKKLDRAADAAGQQLNTAADKVATEAKDAAAKTVSVLDDAAITAKVKGALYAEPGLKMLQLEVSTQNGVVTLNGSVDTPQLKQRAVEIAGAMSGVRSVVDKLVVKS